MKNAMTTDQIQAVCVVIAAEMSGNPNLFNYSWNSRAVLLKIVFLLLQEKARGTYVCGGQAEWIIFMVVVQ